MIITSPVLIGPIQFPYNGAMCVSAVCFGLLGGYVYFVYANIPALGLGSMMLLFCVLIAFEKLKADTQPLLMYASVGLIYILGAHYAIQFNGMTVSTDDGLIIIVLIMALFFWFKPVCDKLLKRYRYLE